jgi:hypothetical protein
MNYRALTVSAVLATGVMGIAPLCHADIVASEDGIAVRDAGVAAPARGMTMTQVAGKFGDPLTKVPAVGKPPISRWEYSGFVVYFERDHVIHAVVSGSAQGEASGSASPPATAAPPAPAAEPAPAGTLMEAPMEAPSAAPVTAPAAPAPPVAMSSARSAPSAAMTSAPSAPPAAVTSAPSAPAAAIGSAPSEPAMQAPAPGAAAPSAPADSEAPPAP